MKIPKIGRGIKMSVAKGALLAFCDEPEMNFVYSGDISFFHKAIDYAGAKHCGPATHHQVLACLRSSPYWEVNGTIPGWGERRANTYVPSEKGEAWLKSQGRDL